MQWREELQADQKEECEEVQPETQEEPSERLDESTLREQGRKLISDLMKVTDGVKNPVDG